MLHVLRSTSSFGTLASVRLRCAGRLLLEFASLVERLLAHFSGFFLCPHVDGLLGRLEVRCCLQLILGYSDLNDTLAVGIGRDRQGAVGHGDVLLANA